MRSFDGRVAFVTGASRGIGRAIAEALGARGAAVVVNHPGGMESEEAAAAVSAITAAGGRALAVEADLTQLAAIEPLFDACEKAFGNPDFVISNVGGIVRSCRIADFDEALFDQVMTLNVKSAFFVLQQAARRVRDGGRIIALSSSTTSQPYPGTAVYGGGKAAVELFCRVLAHEVGERGITVNSVAPGLTTSHGMLVAPPPDARIAQVIGSTPLKRLGTPDDVAQAVLMLLGDDAGWITGQCIHAGGGFH
ncbi:SDR family oxidoreductase [Novosphingobium sp. PASSN1]|uniref:SDR family oxidoreductase n=1 Tax=Novosphingobium sp. PASSN1 TaxID=2015561 RepID=UPI000BC3F11E|nr:SDR family oxidoreductase [Novosphingobium sp. PASSN1]OYU34783.1 MAG: 3-ketoacyl-ACP reductase [Novosphingobium sp. PASSN1]